MWCGWLELKYLSVLFDFQEDFILNHPTCFYPWIFSLPDLITSYPIHVPLSMYSKSQDYRLLRFLELFSSFLLSNNLLSKFQLLSSINSDICLFDSAWSTKWKQLFHIIFLHLLLWKGNASTIFPILAKAEIRTNVRLYLLS